MAPYPRQRVIRWVLMLLVLVALVGAAQMGGQLAPTGERMVEAAAKFLATLNDEQRKAASFPFDSAERTAWYFVPLQDRNRQPTRKGLRLEVMNEGQKSAALGLLRSGLSEQGYQRALTIISLESILAEQEKGRAVVRNPGWYFVTIFGTPASRGSWGWRMEGHHLSLNFTLEGTRVTGITPAFFGANPAEVKEGEQKGMRPLPGSLDVAVDLMKSLDPGRSQSAWSSPLERYRGRPLQLK